MDSSASSGRMDELASLLGRIHENLPQAAATLHKQSLITADTFVKANEH